MSTSTSRLQIFFKVKWYIYCSIYVFFLTYVIYKPVLLFSLPPPPSSCITGTVLEYSSFYPQALCFFIVWFCIVYWFLRIHIATWYRTSVGKIFLVMEVLRYSVGESYAATCFWLSALVNYLFCSQRLYFDLSLYFQISHRKSK